ncbi:MAG: hypothetical protein M1833_005688 [Piccolia ochrophora]|nr:MAG: hypothetical protein M1833_005688 [Piccolia ochrophora]
MAPSRKKKKAAVNLSRGFATTSLPSKKAHPDTDGPQAPESEEFSAASQATATPEDVQKTTEVPHASDDYKNLTPEELGRKLEIAELMSLVLQHAEKVKRDSRRQASQLQTDRRVLRTTKHLLTEQWLPSDVIQDILDLAKLEDWERLTHTGTMKRPQAAEDDITVRLWALRQTLIALNFQMGKISEVIHYLVAAEHVVAKGQDGGTKTLIWGLQEAIHWLAVNCDRDELPSYNGQRKTHAAHPPASRGNFPFSSASSRAGATNSPNFEGTTEPSHRLDQQKTAAKEDQKIEIVPSESAQSSSEMSTDDSREEENSIEPENLIAKHLTLKSRIYELEPSLLQTRVKKSRRKGPPTESFEKDPAAHGQVSGLLRRLRQIESDILFDQGEADMQWAIKKIEIDSERSDRRRLGLELAEPTCIPRESVKDASRELSDSDRRKGLQAERSSQPLFNGTGGNSTDHSADESAENETAILGALFEDSQGSGIPPSKETVDTACKSEAQVTITARDFGTWTGTHPRRILEESCRAKDPDARVNTNTTALSSYSVRAQVTVSWSRDYNLDSTRFSSLFSFDMDPRRVFVAMETISARNIIQAESLVCTAALFYIFGSSSGKESKVYLRLPSTWREVWSEFATAERHFTEEEDCSLLENLRELVRAGRHDPGMETDGNVKMMPHRQKDGSIQDDQRVRTEDTVVGAEGQSSPNIERLKETWIGRVATTRYQTMLPRRISAISLAKRVSEELGEAKHDVGSARSFVGYAVRLESRISKETRLVFATTGILMRMLESSHDLIEVTHLIVDEVHERSIECDFLLIVLRELRKRRPGLKIILMSATVDAQRFSVYFDGAPSFTIPGRTFPVETKYLEDALELTNYKVGHAPLVPQLGSHANDADDRGSSDSTEKEPSAVSELKGYGAQTLNSLAHFNEYRIDYNLLLRLIEAIATEQPYVDFSKAILVFLPGIGEIRRLHQLLSTSRTFSSGWTMYSMHSTISGEDQERAFLIPPRGVRKIVLATNIAETGITIPDITCVIDAGKHKEMRSDIYAFDLTD